MTVGLAAAESLESDALVVLLGQLALVLAVATALGRGARRVGLPPVVGELLTGIVLGPSLFGAALPDAYGAVFAPERLDLLVGVSWLGLLLLMTLVGLETDLGVVRRRGRATGLIAVGSVAVPFALSGALAFAVPEALLADPARRGVFALFVATAMSISAIPVVARILLDFGLLEAEFGQLSVAAALLNDTVGWLLLAVVAAVAAGASRPLATLPTALLALAGVALLAATVGRWLLARFVAGRDDPTALALLVALAFAAGAATQALGLEAILGAFVVGAVAGETDSLDPASVRALERVTIGVLAPLFFAVAGLRVELGALADPVVAAVGLVALTVAIVGKFVGATGGALLAGLPTREALGVGAVLNARGAMEVVVATVGLRLGILTDGSYAVIVLIAIVTSAMAPPLLRRALGADRLRAAAGRRR